MFQAQQLQEVAASITAQLAAAQCQEQQTAYPQQQVVASETVMSALMHSEGNRMCNQIIYSPQWLCRDVLVIQR
jgi:hypothetical protein